MEFARRLVTEGQMGLGTADHVIEEMFLSPRVVDAATFTELADALRSLVRQAVDHRGQLVEATECAAKDREATQDSVARLQAQIGPAARLVPTLDDRIERARLAAERLVDPQALIGPALEAVTQAATSRCESAAQQQSAMLDARREQFDLECTGVVDAQIDRLEMLVSDLEERAARAEQRLASAESVLASGVRAAEASAEAMATRAVKERVEEALRHAVALALEPLVEAAQSRVSQCIEDGLRAIASATREAKQITLECQQAATEFDERAGKAGAAVSERVAEEISGIERRVSLISQSLRKNLDQHEADASRVVEQSHAALVARLNDTDVRSSHVCERVDDSLVGLEARAGSIAERLARRIDELAADADMLAQDTKRRIEQNQPSRAVPSAETVAIPPAESMAEPKATPPAKKSLARKSRAKKAEPQSTKAG